MPAVVVDTHSILWYLAKDPALSKLARAALNEASAEGHPIDVPSICLVELTYLIEKGGLPAVARERLIRAVDDPGGPCVLAFLDRRVAEALGLFRAVKCRICQIALWPRPLLRSTFRW